MKEMWIEVGVFRQGQLSKAWCIIGDFNSIRRQEERKSVMSDYDYSREIKGFNEIIESSKLADIPLVGRKFTWFKPNGLVKSRIDRVLVSKEWLDLWPNSQQFVLRRSISNHCAVILKEVSVDLGLKPFRCLDVWQRDSGFKEFVRSSWVSYKVVGRGIFVFKEKLKRLKADLKVWNKEVFGDVNQTSKEIQQRLDELDLRDDDDGLDDLEREERKSLFAKLSVSKSKQEAILFQKARQSWIKQGDLNTKYFHSSVKWRRARNQLHGIFVNIKWSDNKEEVKNKVSEFFEERFARKDVCQVILDKVDFNSISEVDNEMLVGEVSEEEVKAAIWGCDSSKSPGSDGFNFGFIKSCWDILKEDVVLAVKDFACYGSWPRGSNASFLCLIPKVENPQQLGEFRPISLVGCLYKIISKALSLRLKKVIGKIIDARQSTFLEGRGLIDSVLVANEVLEEYKRKRKSYVVFKVDYEKAYDSVNLDFLYYMLRRLGFCDRWFQWIKGCLESASVSVLVNGSPTREFFPRRGLRQGDPLAPFLFLIVAEGLVGVARVAEEKKLIDNLEVGKDKVRVNMLQYADDTLLFCEANVKSVFNIKAILQCFQLSSGLRVNFGKSRIGGTGLDQVMLQRFASILNCETMVVPFIYLGMLVEGSHKRGDFWNGVIEKVQARLSRWKGRCLTMAERICLIKFVLSSIPLFYMSLFKLPSGVAGKLIRMQRSFLWGWGAEGRKMAWASWSQVCKPRKYGRLEVGVDREWPLEGDPCV